MFNIARLTSDHVARMMESHVAVTDRPMSGERLVLRMEVRFWQCAQCVGSE
jgi:hypothetical protein